MASQHLDCQIPTLLIPHHIDLILTQCIKNMAELEYPDGQRLFQRFSR